MPYKILWVRSRQNDGCRKWNTAFTSDNTTVIEADMLPASLGKVSKAEIDVIIAEASDSIQDAIDLCLRLRQGFDTSLLLITCNVTEDFAVAVYGAGVDECISGPIGTNLLREKINAHGRWMDRVNRIGREAQSFLPGSNGEANASGLDM